MLGVRRSIVFEWWDALPNYLKLVVVVCGVAGLAGNVSFGKPAETPDGVPRWVKIGMSILLGLLAIALLGLWMDWWD